MSKYFSVLLFISMVFFVGIIRAQDDDFIGQIAYIGTDDNVYLLSSWDTDAVPLTTDATMLKQYQWPTWSTSGDLAFFSLEASDTGSFVTEALVRPASATDILTYYSGTNQFFNYGSWSPNQCEDVTSCHDLALLLSEPAAGLFVEMVHTQNTDIEHYTVGYGQPFYTSWNPTGEKLLLQRNNQRLDIYDTLAREIETELALSPGLFQAPQWSPVGDNWLVAVEQATGSDLILGNANGDITVIATGLQGLTHFAWSPDGRYVAYTDQPSPLMIYDVAAQEIVAETLSDVVGAFFWSPDSSQIAFITVSNQTPRAEAVRVSQQEQRRPLRINWSVLTVADGQIQQYRDFSPTAEMIYLFQYFDQFAQSHQVWSPDSRYIVYAERTDNGGELQVIDTQSAGIPVFAVGAGKVGIWSYTP